MKFRDVDMCSFLKRGVVAFAMLVLTTATHAADAVKVFPDREQACRDIAVEVGKALRDLSLLTEKKIGVHSFIKLNDYPSGDLRGALVKAFEAAGFVVDPEAQAFIKGTITTNPKSISVIDVTLFTRSEGSKHVFKKWLIDDPVIAGGGENFDKSSELAAASAPLAKPVKEIVGEAFSKKPEVVLTDGGTVARPAKDSKFGLSFVVHENGKQVRLPIQVFDGKPFVQLKMNQEFSLFVTNDSTSNVGVAAAIDGVNIFVHSKKPEFKKLGKLWVPPEGGRIDGWYYANDDSRRFRFGSFADSNAKKYGETDEVGGVSVLFFEKYIPRSTDPPESIPRDVVQGPAASSNGGIPQEAIGEGGGVKSEYQEIQANFGNLIAAVTVRYQNSNHPKDLPGSK